MPGYRGHFFGALLFFGGVLATLLFAGCALSLKWCGQALLWTILGALFPDIDTKSQGQKLFYAMICALVITLVAYKKYLLGSVVALLAFIPLFSRHRALFHSFWFALFLVTLAVAVMALQCPVHVPSTLQYGLFFLVGVYSHLVLDFGIKKSLRSR